MRLIDIISAFRQTYRANLKRAAESRRVEKAQRTIQEAARLAEQFNLPLGGVSGAVDADDYLYRYRSSQLIDRSLQPIDQERLNQIAVWLWMVNPIAFNAIEMIRDYVIGTGFYPEAKNPEVKSVLDGHWFDQINNWEIAQGDRFRDLLLFGEFIPLMFPNPVSGHTKIGVIDPFMVEDIITHPNNIGMPLKLRLKPTSAGESSVEKWIVQVDEDGTLGAQMDRRYEGKDTRGRLVGDVFYFPANRLLSAKRGRSTLLSGSDWLYAYDRFLFARVENVAKAQSFIWDVTIKNGTKTEIDKFLRNFPRDVRSGSMRVHGDRVAYDAVFPDFKSQSAETEAKLLRGMILASLSLPEHWVFEQGENVNRASAMEMGDPTVMRLLRLQNYMRHIIYMCLRYHRDHVIMFSSTQLKGLRAEEEEFSIVSPAIDVENVRETADTLNSVTNSCAVASDYGWAEDRDIAALWCAVASRLGQEIEPAEDLRGKIQEVKRPKRRVPPIYRRSTGH